MIDSDQPSSLEIEDPLKDSPYKDTVEALARDVPHFNETQMIHYVNDHLISAILADAENGLITTKQLNTTTGEKELFALDSEEVMFGLNVMLQALDTPDRVVSPFVSLPRANGLRNTIKVVMGNKKLADTFRYAVYLRDADRLKQRDERANHERSVHVSPEVLAMRTEAAEDLGEEAVADSGVSLEADAARRLLTDDSVEKSNDPLEYLKEVLPPVTRPNVEPQRFVPNGRFVALTKEQSLQKYYDTYVTTINREHSLQTLSEAMKSTPSLQTVLIESGLDVTSLEAVDAIRENANVRFEVAKILFKKLNVLADDPYSDMGARIIDNNYRNFKSDTKTGRNFQSREYAVCLALKMLGGEFSDKDEDGDFERNASGAVILGQHRHAARETLMSYRSET